MICLVQSYLAVITLSNCSGSLIVQSQTIDIEGNIHSEAGDQRNATKCRFASLQLNTENFMWNLTKFQMCNKCINIFPYKLL